MGLTTYRYLAYSIKEAFKESKDDADLRLDSIIFWIQVEVNRLRGERLSKRQIQSGEYLNHFTNVPVLRSGTRKYVEMPSAIVDLIGDIGIHQVTYLMSEFVENCGTSFPTPFERTMPAKIWSLYADPLRTPTPSRPFMARENSLLYLYGIDEINVTFVDMWLYTTVSTLHKLNLDDVVELSDEQISVLNRRVIDLARFAMIMPNDKHNTGSDNNQSPKTALSQANINPQDQEQEQ